MKTKFKVEINAHGNHSDALLKMIGNHNEGLVSIDIDVIKGYLLAKKAQYPSLTDGKVFFVPASTEKSIAISDNEGETFYITITEVNANINELEPDYQTLNRQS